MRYPSERKVEEYVDSTHSAAEDYVVELRNVTKMYPRALTPAVEELSITVRRGEFYSLLGPSGCGKTTTLRLIGGFERPTSGTVRLAGRDVTTLPPYRRDVNTVFQHYALFPNMRVRTNVAYPLKMKRLSKAVIRDRVIEHLARVGLSDLAERWPHELSGGQRQRVALARALIGHPEVVLLDEPLGALDLKLREDMLVVLVELQRDIGITFIYVTHDQGEALAMSDRIAVMNSGRLEQIATPVDLYRKPKTPFVAQFIGKTNLIPCVLTGDGVAMAGSLRIALPDHVPHARGAAVLLSLRPEQIRLAPDVTNVVNRYTGYVSEVLFFGHEQQVMIDSADQRFIARTTAGGDIRLGAPIEFGWDPSSAVVLPPSEAS